MIVVAGALLFGIFALAVTRFGYHQDWHWALFAGLAGCAAVFFLFAPLTTHAVKIDMPKASNTSK